MILRKPYAFFIKHFRLIHVFLSILMLSLLFNTKKLLDFFNEVVSTNLNLKGQELVSLYMPLILRILPFLIIVLLGLLLFIMHIKNKPKTMYITSILIYLYVIIINFISKSTLSTMENTVLATRNVRLIRDFILISFIAQIVISIITIIRAVGFDIKKFDFKKDLKELQIDESDNEEFEFSIDLDSNKLKRNIRKYIRHLKYFYKENKLVVTLIFIVSVISIFSFSLISINKNKLYDLNSYISNNGISLKIKSSYITDTDYKGNVILDDSVFVVIKIDTKRNGSNTLYLDYATVKLNVKNYSFSPISDYKDSFIDFGNIYIEENLKTEYEEKVLIYKIPKQFKDEKMYFNFVAKSTLEEKRIKLNNIDLTSNKEDFIFNLGDNANLKDSILNNIDFTINSIDLNKKYKLSYNFCISNNCKTSYVYLYPSISTNSEKVIMKITGNINTSSIDDLYNLIYDYGTIYYVKNNTTYKNTVPIKRVNSKVNSSNTLYIEVDSNLIDSDNIYIKLQIRNKNYQYNLK